MTEPRFPCTNALQIPNPPFWTTKTAVSKFPQSDGSTPTPCSDKAVHAQGGGGVCQELGNGADHATQIGCFWNRQCVCPVIWVGDMETGSQQAEVMHCAFFGT